MKEILRKIVLWNYKRTSWQWDVMCLTILAFIFLTPARWFDNTEFTGIKKLMRQGASIVLVENTKPQTGLTRAEIEAKARWLLVRPDAEIVNIREQKSSDGSIFAYEVDVR